MSSLNESWNLSCTFRNSISLYISLFPYISHYISIYLSIYLFVSLYLSLYIYISLYISLCSVHQGDAMSKLGGYHEYIGGCSVHHGISWCTWGISRVHRGMFCTLGFSVYKLKGFYQLASPHASRYPPRCTHDIPQCTHGIHLMY